MTSPKPSVDMDDGPKIKEAEMKSLENENRLTLAQNMSEEEFLDAEKKLKLKLDLRLLLCVWIIFVMNYLDRVSRKMLS